MKTEQEIRDRVEAFNAADAEERALWNDRKEIELDGLIAKRQGDDFAVTETAKVLQEVSSAWVKALRARDAAAKDLCEALGVDPAAMKSGL